MKPKSSLVNYTTQTIGHPVIKMDVEEIVIELDETVIKDCFKSTAYTRGRVAVLARLIETEVKKRE